MHYGKIIAGGVTALALATTAVLAASHSGPADGAIKARKAHMQLMAFELGPIGAMAKGEMDYDAEVAAAYAGNLAALASMDWTAYMVEGSDNGSMEGTRLLPAALSDMDGFFKAQNDLATAAAALAESAGNGVEALQAGLGPVGGACGACHKAYRAAAN